MKTQEIEAALIELIERAEYAGRLKGAAIKTRSNREATANHEASDISSRMARVVAHELAVKLGDPDGTVVVRFYDEAGGQIGSKQVRA